MLIKIERPGFLTSLSKAIGKSAGDWTWYSLLPTWSAFFLLIGIGAAYIMPADFWAQDHRGNALLVYAGMIALNGLLISVAWPTSIKMYEVLSTPGFFSYASSEGLMDGYVVYIQLVHGVLLFAMFTSVLGLFALVMNLPYIICDQAALAVMIFSTAYAFKMVSHAVHVMQDILWQKAILDDVPDRQNNKLVPSEKGTLHGLNV